MTAKEILAVEGKRGKVEGDALELAIGTGEDLVVTFDDAKAHEIRYTLALPDLQAASAAWKEVVAAFTKQHGKPAAVSKKGKTERQTWLARDGSRTFRIYVNHYIKRGVDEIGEPDSGVVQVVIDPEKVA